jgi:hypothetical protein
MTDPCYTQSLYHMGGAGGLEVRAGSRWSPSQTKLGEMIADPKGFYVNNLVLREANRRILDLHAAKGPMVERIRELEEEVKRLQNIVATQPVMARAVLERLKADPHAAELFGFVRQLATLLSVETA